MDIGIRRAAPADVPGLVALSAALFAEDGAARDRLRNAAWPRDNAVGHLIGHFYCASAMWTAARTKLISMYVMPGYRDRNLGGRLAEAFFAWSRDRGAGRFRVKGARSAAQQSHEVKGRAGLSRVSA
jgi:GNAT superfamily N-acetyltransferase